MSPYDKLTFALADDVPQLKTVDSFDVEQIKEEFGQLQDSGIQDVSQFNAKYLEMYKPHDASAEFRDAVARNTFKDHVKMPTFDELTSEYDQLDMPYLDQAGHSTDHLAPHQKYWADNGYLLAEGLIAKEKCDEFLELRKRLDLGTNGFRTFTPYLEHDVIKNMFCSVEMNMIINDLIGEQLGLHFNLSPFVSTERGWHQDEYLNPPGTNGRYLAVWIAVDDVPEESGPFEFIRGSHKYRTVSRDKVMPYLKEEFQAGPDNRQDWSVHSSMFINPAYFYKFCLEDKKITKFLGKKGDVLFWHSRLIHRGSPPTGPAVRPGIIGHFSPIRTARWFGGEIRRNGNGGYYWHSDEWTEASRYG